MKSKIKRLLALVLCLTMVLNGNVSLLASDETTPEEQAVAEVVEEMTEEVAEEATEEVTEEVEEVEAVTEQPEVVEEKTEEVVEEQIADNTKNDSLVLKTELNGTVITMSGPRSSFPEGTDYSVSASELSEEALSDVEASLRKVELKTEEKIASYKAYDIKLIVDGKEAQPVGDVNVTFQGAEVKEQVAKADNVEVYHVDEEKQVAEEVKGEVDNNEVVMTTDHFSTYVITTSSTKVNVTVEHLLSSNGSPLYRTSTIELSYRERLEDISVAANYTVDRVVKVVGENETEISGDDLITADTTYRVYYVPTTGTTFGLVQMFDYQVRPSKTGEQSINIKSNYEDCDDNTKVTMGKNDQNDRTRQYKTYINGKNVNDFTGGHNSLTGIITGVDYETGALKMGQSTAGLMHEPGFFTTLQADGKQKPGKQILDGYSLLFDRSGDTYTLSSIWKDNKIIQNTGADFWPLDAIKDEHPDSSNSSTRNYFFGMRYDIEFTIGDYVGPLNYSFTGDDDLWVVLDARNSETGGKVVVDIGGIHQYDTGSVNIWNALGITPEKITEKQKNEKHTLTILYLERGGVESNCYMNFTLPNSKVISSVINPITFEFNKVNSSGAAVEGATFELYNSNHESLGTAISDENGKVVFNNLLDGTYFIKETIAPAGYVKDSKEYKLTIVDSEPTLTLEGSTDSITSIVNHTLIENIDYNKTVSVDNYDSRIYKIVLSAKTKYEPEAIQASEIVDVIDSRFALTQSCKDVLDANENVVVTVDQTTGETIIKWSGEEAVINEAGWMKEIYIQAKPEFIGGNAIPTNGPASGIKVGNDTLSFPQPSVNVKLLDFAVKGHEITVYKGDIVNTTEFANVLAKSLKVTKLYDTKDDQFEVLSDGLSQAQLKTLNETKTLEIPYSYKGTEDVEGKFTLKLVLDPNAPDNETKGEEAISDSHAEMVSGDKVEIYRLVVSYIPLSVAERMALGLMERITQPASNGGEKVTSDDLDEKEADYIVNVIEVVRDWAFIKKSTSSTSDNLILLDGAEFRLKSETNTYIGKSQTVNGETGVIVWYQEGSNIPLQSHENIVEGVYVFEETKAPAGYMLGDVKWEVTIVGNGYLKSIVAEKGDYSLVIDGERSLYYIDNTPLYELPHSGGLGIYTYTIGGILLMAFATLILYKNRRKEVLARY